MLVRDHPAATVAAQPEREPQSVVRGPLRQLVGRAAGQQGRGEPDVHACGHVYRPEFERRPGAQVLEERRPRLGICLEAFDASTGWGDVEHGDVTGVPDQHTTRIAGGHAAGPPLDQLADGGHVVAGVVARTVTVRFSDSESTHRRGRPIGVIGAAVFIHTTPDVDPCKTVGGWTFYGYTTERRLDVTFPEDVAPGQQVYLTAHWLSPRLEPGPLATPTPVNIQGGGVSNALRGTLARAA